MASEAIKSFLIFIIEMKYFFSSSKVRVVKKDLSNYSTLKCGFIKLTKVLAKVLGWLNISISTVYTGFIMTDLNRHDEGKKV